MVAMRKNALTILDTMRDPALFGPWFRGESWQAWRVFLSALFGLPLDKKSLAIFQKHTGRKNAPTSPAKEGWLVAGRRGGKSRMAALAAAFLACFR